MENPIKIHDFGGPPIFGNTHIEINHNDLHWGPFSSLQFYGIKKIGGISRQIFSEILEVFKSEIRIELPYALK